MTLVATYKWGGNRYAVCDTAIGVGDGQYQCTGKFWRPMAGLLIGFAGNVSTYSRIQYGTGVDPSGRVRETCDWMYSKIVGPSYGLFKDINDGDHADMLLMTKNKVFVADTFGSLTEVTGDCAIGSGAQVATGFMFAKGRFDCPRIFGKVMLQAVSASIPSVSPHAVIELVL